MRMDFARHIYTNLLQIRVVTSTSIPISTGAKAFLESPVSSVGSKKVKLLPFL
jgi:hypothetical protein